MSDIEYNPSEATLIDPVPVKVGEVSVEESTSWNGWAYCNAEALEPTPIAMFRNRAHAAAFVAFLASEHCPDGLRKFSDAAIMAAHVPQIVVANHWDDSESAEAMAGLCGGRAGAWVEETSDEAAGK